MREGRQGGRRREKNRAEEEKGVGGNRSLAREGNNNNQCGGRMDGEAKKKERGRRKRRKAAASVVVAACQAKATLATTDLPSSPLFFCFLPRRISNNRLFSGASNKQSPFFLPSYLTSWLGRRNKRGALFNEEKYQYLSFPGFAKDVPENEIVTGSQMFTFVSY